MNVSIIIPCYLLPDNDDELLRFTEKCLASIRQYTGGEYELILIDNGSPVHGDYLREEADVYIHNKTNLGYGPAVNQGLRLARGEWLIVSNNDVRLVDDWIGGAIEGWQEKTGAISSHLYENDPKRKAGRQVSHSGLMFGALWLTRREAIDQVGYLDEEFEFGYYEDRDLWRRLEKAGYELVKIGHCHHAGNLTSGKMANLPEFFFRNKMLYEKKWGITNG